MSISPVQIDLRKLGETTWWEYGIRFGFGGLVTAIVGVLSTMFGPTVGGLFLAFPAIAIASLTLIARHSEQRPAAGADAFGAAAGSIGLVAFGAVVWWLAPRVAGVWVLLVALSVWLVVSLLVWAAGDALRRRDRT
jgi:uncharacterized membrane protein (GlpM family)